MVEQHAVVGVFASHMEAESSIRGLKRAGFDMKNLSVVGKDIRTADHVIGFYLAEGRVKFWGKLGAFWSGLLSLLFGSALFVVTGLGPLVVFGPMVNQMIGALEGARVVGGLNVLTASLDGLGIPKTSCEEYETAIMLNQFLVIAQATGDEAAAVVRNILKVAGAAQIGVHPEQPAGLVG